MNTRVDRKSSRKGKTKQRAVLVQIRYILKRKGISAAGGN
jgi:hypothetical protein